MLRILFRVFIMLSLLTTNLVADEQNVTIKLDMDITLKGAVIGEDDWTITIRNDSGTEINVKKYEILQIKAGKEDVTAQYLTGGQLRTAQERRQEQKKERIKSVVGVAALFIAFMVVSQTVLTTGGGDGGPEIPGTGHGE
ncbi:MAG: hypothetical protein JSU61_08340 [Fidelibacterota bacterium]|nr:MAG: hypothetical protein JSU61_08340 [Candidatus Neomarinimicrobiota bacterium]